MSAYTVIASHRYGRHGAAQPWFRSEIEAIQHAQQLAANSQIGRNTCTGTAHTLAFYVVEALRRVHLPTPVAIISPVNVNLLTYKAVKHRGYRVDDGNTTFETDKP